jgi:transposase
MIDNTGVKAFRQIRREIRGSDKHLIVGLDMAKEKHYAFLGTANGRTLLKKVVFENSMEGFEKLLTHVDAVKTQAGLEKTVFGMEPTADYHKALAEFLIKNGHFVALVAAGAAKKNRELLDGRWDKHDTKDAANVADLISQGKFLYYDFPSEQVKELRSLLSLKRKLKKQDHSLRMRIRNHLVAQYFPELDRYYSRCEEESLAIVMWCLNPAQIAGMDFEQFCRMVTTRARGGDQRRRLQAI